MKRPNITPGPWKAYREITSGEFVTETRIRSADDSHIAHVTPCAVEANARAIAAVPALLEALEMLLLRSQKHLPQNADHDGLANCDALAKARAALIAAGYQF